jgi:release factor glutamine methyltransferase
MTVNIQTIQDIKPHLLKELRVLYPDTEINALAAILIKTVSGRTKLQQLANPRQLLTVKQRTKINEITRELKKGRPIQYILGQSDFYNCIISLNNSVLIPRPETEELVDLVIRENKTRTGVINDACTGSGCIAIALAYNLPGFAVSGFDISHDAVELAKENSLLNNTNVSFFHGNLLQPGPELLKKRCSILVSNPPYVRESEKKFMSANVLDYEPHSALFVPDEDPLIFYRALISLSYSILEPSGLVYFEINEALGTEVEEMLSAGGFTEVRIVSDINGKDRIIKGKKDD